MGRLTNEESIVISLIHWHNVILLIHWHNMILLIHWHNAISAINLRIISDIISFVRNGHGKRGKRYCTEEVILYGIGFGIVKCCCAVYYCSAM